MQAKKNNEHSLVGFRGMFLSGLCCGGIFSGGWFLHVWVSAGSVAESVAESVAGEKHKRTWPATWKRVAKFPTSAGVLGVTPNCRFSVGVPAVVGGEIIGEEIQTVVSVGMLGVPPLTHGPGSGMSPATTVSRVAPP